MRGANSTYVGAEVVSFGVVPFEEGANEITVEIVTANISGSVNANNRFVGIDGFRLLDGG